jgi:hypothetical protein
MAESCPHPGVEARGKKRQGENVNLAYPADPITDIRIEK